MNDLEYLYWADLLANGAVLSDIGLAAVKQDLAVVTPVSSSAGVLTINCALGDYFTVALTENIDSWAFTNTPGTGYGMSKIITFTQHAGSAKTVAMPTGSTWAGGTVGVISTGLGAVDILALTSTNNGSTWRNTLAKAFA